MKRNDREALKLAHAKLRAESEARREQLDQMSWEEGAKLAAFHFQMWSLDLKPWQEPPSQVYDDEPIGEEIHGRREALQLLRQMFEHNISRWHPFPLEAIEEAKAKAKAAT